MKNKETLEEVAEREYPEKHAKDILSIIKQEAFINGAEYQQQRSYSEEEVIGLCMSAYNQATKDGSKAWLGTFDKWFEQFKKK